MRSTSMMAGRCIAKTLAWSPLIVYMLANSIHRLWYYQSSHVKDDHLPTHLARRPGEVRLRQMARIHSVHGHGRRVVAAQLAGRVYRAVGRQHGRLAGARRRMADFLQLGL